MLHLPVNPAFEKNNLAITLQSSEFFAPYASVTLLSIIENASSENNYDILILTWDMKEETAEKLVAMKGNRENISVRVIDVSQEIEKYKKVAQKRADYNRFSAVGVVRLLLPELLDAYDTILSLDSDLLIRADVSELFQYDLTDYYMGGVPDIVCYIAFKMPKETYFTKEYVYNDLELNSMAEYCNGGLLLLNLRKIRNDFSTDQIMRKAMINGVFRRVYEQDTFNSLFREKKLLLPAEWNWYVDAKNVFGVGAQKFSPNDEVLKKYYVAEKVVKNYHFLTAVKPWEDATIIHAEKWWIMARKTPFLEQIIERVSGGNAEDSALPARKETKKYLLFLCDSPYQLLNVLNIKYHYYRDVPADLILCQSVNLKRYKEKLEQINMFNKIIVSNYDSHFDYDKILDIPIKDRTCHPEEYEHALALEPKYTDYFMSVYHYHYYQMIYYQLVNAGNIPKVHMIEDGGATYVHNFNKNEKQDIDHSMYSESKRFVNNVESIFIYRPDLYCGKGRIPKLPIPQIDEKDDFVNVVHAVFGEFKIPNVRYLFFNECFSEDGNKISNDVQLLDLIADIVGKENIAVKMHPRSIKAKEIYKAHGYSFFLDSDTPWEVAAFSSELNDKVLVSVSSNTIWTPTIIAGKKVRSISFFNLMKLSRRIWDYPEFMHRMKDTINKKEVSFYMPNTVQELKLIVQYIEGEMQ